MKHLTRKLQDGTEVEELNEARILTIKTKCPRKWQLYDRETGELYEPWPSVGKHDWKLIGKKDA